MRARPSPARTVRWDARPRASPAEGTRQSCLGCGGRAGGPPGFRRCGYPPVRRGPRASAARGYRFHLMDLTLLEDRLRQGGEPGYRVGQIWSWAARGAPGYGAMTSVPAGLRAQLAESVPYSTLELADEARSRDGTLKALFRTADGHPVETVLMRYRDGRRSLCLSSQSGCPLTCTFCATGRMRFGRNLTAWEILDQALHFRRSEEVDHAVFMGMGEPMLNFDHVLQAALRLPDLGITHRRTTISTVGWLPGLRRFVDEVDAPIRLALSLHAPNDALRSELMPVNDRYPLEDISRSASSTTDARVARSSSSTSCSPG